MRLLAAALLALTLAPRGAAAQGRGRDSTGTTDSTAARAPKAPPCDGLPVRDITVTALRPPFSGKSSYWRRAARAVGLHHATTDSAVVRRFLTLEVGQSCSEERLRESERLLRAQHFLAAARVWSVPDSAGGVHVLVETVDDIPAFGSVAIAGTTLRALEIGNDNVLGEAWLLSAGATHRELEGPGGRLHAIDRQLFGRPYLLDVLVEQAARQRALRLAAGHAYMTDLQRIAWEVGATLQDPQLVRLDAGRGQPNIAVAYRRWSADVGGVVRLGTERWRVLTGGMVAAADIHAVPGFVLTDTGPVRDPAIASTVRRERMLRPSAIVGLRHLRYRTVRGFDALTAAQDVATGAQTLLQVGRGLPILGSAGHWFLAGDLLAGAGGQRAFVGGRVSAEARRPTLGAGWRGVVLSSRVSTYLRPNARDLVHLWADGDAASASDVPVQLHLTTGEDRVPGYDRSLAGGRRVGGGVEVRHLLGRLAGRGDVGLAVSALGGQLRAGDAPFGVDTPLLSALAFDVVAAVPTGSKRLLRLGVAFPLRAGPSRTGHGFELRASFFDRTSVLATVPGDVSEGRTRYAGPEIFAP